MKITIEVEKQLPSHITNSPFGADSHRVWLSQLRQAERRDTTATQMTLRMRVGWLRQRSTHTPPTKSLNLTMSGFAPVFNL